MVSTPAASTGFDLVHAVHFHLEVRGVPQLRLGRQQQAGEPGRVSPGHHGQVVVLGEDGVGQAVPVVGAAAAAHGMAFEDAQPGGGLPGVGDPGGGSVHQTHEFGRFGGNRGHPLDQVEGHAFGQQHRAGTSADPGEVGSGVERFPVLHQELHPGIRVNQQHGVAEHRGAAEHPGHAGVQDCRGAGTGGNEQLGGDVAGGGVLGEGALQDVPDGGLREGGRVNQSWTRLAFGRRLTAVGEWSTSVLSLR